MTRRMPWELGRSRRRASSWLATRRCLTRRLVAARLVVLAVACSWLGGAAAAGEGVSDFSVGPFGGGDVECGALVSYIVTDAHWPELVWPNTPGPRSGTLERFVNSGWGENAWTLGQVRPGPPTGGLDLAGEWKFRFDKTADDFRRDGFLRGDRGGWKEPGFDDSAWRAITVPGEWRGQTGAPNGYAWHRRVFAIEKVEPTLLYVGGIDDASTIYLNGREVGRTRGWKTPHQFDVTRLLRAGKNVIAVAVEDLGGGAGITSPIRLMDRSAGAVVVERVEQSVNWTTKVTELTLAGGRFFRYYASRVSPMFVAETDLGQLCVLQGMSARGQGPPAWMAVPAARGVRVLRPTRQPVDPRELAEPWLLVWFNGSESWTFDAPVLVVLQHRPTSIRWMKDGLHLDHGEVPCGQVAVMPLFGVRRVGLDETAPWSRRLPADVIERCRLWARAARAFPVGCHDSFEVVAGGAKVECTDRFVYLRSDDDWGTRPLEMAPVPPVLSLAEASGYPVEIERRPEGGSVATFFGPYRFVTGTDTVRYRLPGPAPYLDVTWETPRPGWALPDEPWAREASKRLNDGARRELPADIRGLTPPLAQTWALGSHAQRVTSAIISIPFLEPDAQRLAREYVSRATAEVILNPAYYTTYVEPTTGRKVTLDLLRVKEGAGARECDIPWSHGHVFVCLDTYARRMGGLDAVRDAWPTLKKSFGVFEFTQDWPIMSHYAHTHGYGVGGEDKLISLAGMIAYASLGRQLGDKEAFERCSCLAAKMMASHKASLVAPAWAYKQRGPLPWVTEYFYLGDEPRDRTMLGEGWHEVYGLQLCTYTAPPKHWFLATDVNPPYPALMAFMADHTAETVRRIEYELLPEYTPLWDRYGQHGQGAHVVVRRWLFGESPARCWQYVTEGLDAGGNFATFENLPRAIVALLGPSPRAVRRLAPPREVHSRDVDEFSFKFSLSEAGLVAGRKRGALATVANRRDFALEDVSFELALPGGRRLRRGVGALAPRERKVVRVELSPGGVPDEFLAGSRARFRYRSGLDGASCVQGFGLGVPPRDLVLGDFEKGTDGFVIADCNKTDYGEFRIAVEKAPSPPGVLTASSWGSAAKVTYTQTGRGGGDGVTIRKMFPTQDWRYWRLVRAHVYIPDDEGTYHGLISVNTRKAHWQPSQGFRLSKGWNVVWRRLEDVAGLQEVGRIWVRVTPEGRRGPGHFYVDRVELRREAAQDLPPTGR